MIPGRQMAMAIDRSAGFIKGHRREPASPRKWGAARAPTLGARHPGERLTDAAGRMYIYIYIYIHI